MGTTEVRITLTDAEHSEMKDDKGEATWKDALVAGVAVVGDE
jgi:hypothetical protein